MKLRELKELIDICSDDPVAMEQDVEIECKGTVYQVDRVSQFKVTGTVIIACGDQVIYQPS